MILHSDANDLSHQNRLVNLNTTNSDNLILIHRDNRLQHPGLLQGNESCRTENVDLAVLNHAGLNQSDRILTSINSHSDNRNSSLISSSHNVHSLPMLQVSNFFF